MVQLDIRGDPHRPPDAGRPSAGRRRRRGLRALLPLLEPKTDTGPARDGTDVRYQALAGAQQRAGRPDVRRASRRACSAAGATTPTAASAPRRWPRRPSTGTPPTTPSSPPTPAWRRSGSSRFVQMRGTAPAARLVQPRLDGQRDAAGAGRPGAGPRPAGRGVLRRRRPVDAARRPDHRRHARPAGQARRLRQRPAGHGQARAGAGRAARVRHRAGQPRLRRGREAIGPARHPRHRPRRPRAGAVRRRFAHDGPVLLDVLTNPDEIAVPPKPTGSRAGASPSPRRGSSSTARSDAPHAFGKSGTTPRWP